MVFVHVYEADRERESERGGADEKKDGEQSRKKRARRRPAVCKCRWAVLIRVHRLLIDWAVDED